MDLISIDMSSLKLANSRILLYGKCVPQQFDKHLQKFKKGRIKLAACLQEHHMDNLGFKLATLLLYQVIKEIIVLSIDGSPHCVQLHALAEQAKRITKSNVVISHYVIEEGKLFKVTAETVKAARHLSQISKLEKGQKA